MRRIPLNLLAMIAPLAAQAEAARPFASPAAVTTVPHSGVGSLGQVTLALGLVLALIFGVAWAVRRMRGFGKPQGAALDVLANLPLGQKERAVLIRCGSTQILLGVAPGRVDCLHVLAEPIKTDIEAPRSSLPTTDFKSILKRSLGL
jgi:flagellar protein FliO/FliZ